MTFLETVTDPIIQAGTLAATGAIVSRVALRNNPRLHLIFQVTFFIVLTTLLLYHGIVPYEAGPPTASAVQKVFIGIAKVIWWINAAWALVGFARVFLIFERRPREGRLIQDLVVGIIYLGAVLSVVANVFSLPVGTLIATSGVLAIILGLALQSTLSDVFSGIALNLGRPYVIGDLIVLSDGTEGRVVETNWRATHLLNSRNDLVIVPNSDLAKARLINISSPDRSHGISLTVRFAGTTLPSAIVDMMHSVLLSSTTILNQPEPFIQIKSLDGSAVELELSFRIADIAVAATAQNEIFDLIYRHSMAAGIPLATPVVLQPASGAKTEPSAGNRSSQMRLLDAIPLFKTLTEDEKEILAKSMSRRTYRKSDVVAEQGSEMQSLLIVRSGVLVVTREEGRRKLELGKLAPGDYFGEASLLAGAGEPGTVRALASTVVYEIAKSTLAPLLHDRPSLVDELGLILCRRAQSEKHLFENSTEIAGIHAMPGLVKKIRLLFELSHLERN
ncbi:Small-conductance mechanosensitive channel [Phyllobacterium sp. CL33Tsu]|uniref:mechanosensitive ion channel family protein n=1 Tax=Phyllobacterium sp. CL33Tsu TaxID=1798191 RepID=UPI0008E28704|nr:mechanosensitive ion channel family protein [Phyllobacterium sp. CL33Tsu]SFJ50365.1 Small-conductance mechanosensitive channel [Phyllobacterium sp. CL33Tsu]